MLALSIDGVAPEIGAPHATRIIDGSPTFRTWSVEERADGLYAGVWESTPGEWRVEYDEWEYCRILFGVSVITQDGAAPKRLIAGDSFIIRPGFSGVWRVIETTRKEYVIKV